MPIINDKVTSFTFNHADQPDRPNTVFPSSLALKQAFDSRATQLQTGLNDLIDNLLATTVGDSGAHNVGSETILGVAGNTVFDQLTDLKVQIQAIVGANIPPGSITTAMLQDGSVTNPKIATGAVSHSKLSAAERTASVGGRLYAYQVCFGV